MTLQGRTIRILGVHVAAVGLVLFLGLAYATLLIGSAFTRIDAWYYDLAKPAWTPPGWLIGAVWTVLYTLIGLASAIAWSGSTDPPSRRLFAVCLGTNLILNAGWSAAFFTLHEVGMALAEIAFLAASTVVLALVAFRRARPAGWLLVPYAGWVVFAAFLNFTIWRLNP